MGIASHHMMLTSGPLPSCEIKTVNDNAALR
jgi:hypothetical protein